MVPVYPPWSLVLRALREARGVSQDAWAGVLGRGRKTVQRWESGETIPDALAEAQLIEHCREAGLFRRYGAGPLQGLDIDADVLTQLLAEARIEKASTSRSLDAASNGAASSESSHDAPISADQEGSGIVSPPLPIALTSFVDRQDERVSILDRVAGNRLLTLTGSGGVGKTRLALSIAEQMRDRRGISVAFVPLAPIVHPRFVPAAIARTLGVIAIADEPLLDALIAHIGDAQLFLILDNFEHLLPAATTVSDLLANCPRLRVLVTSRAPLRLRGEQEFPLRPLAVGPPDEVGSPTGDNAPAVELFFARAREVRPSLVHSRESLETAVQICRRLDGLPLAIELAAARARVLTLPALLTQLAQPLSLLTGGSRDLPQRQQSARQTIAWSYELLNADEQALFRRLAVFAGGCSLAAVTAINDDRSEQTLDLLQSLVEQSLLVMQDSAENEPRFTMLDTIRAFAQERLDESDEAAVVRTKHLRFYRRLAGSIVRGVPGSDGAAVLHALEPEIDNVRAALTWSLSDDALAYDGLPLALGMIALWTVGHLWEGCEWLQRLLATGAGAESAARAWALHNLAQMLIYCGGFALALPAITDCIELSRRIERPDTLVHSLSLLALTQRGFGPAAVRSADEAVEVARKTGDPSLLLRALYTLGSVTFWQGDLERSREASAEAVVWGRKSLISVMTAAPLRELGNVAYRQGDYATAKRYCLESLTLLQTLGREPTMAQTLASLGRIALAEGDTEEAEFRFQEVLELARTTGSGHYLALALSGLAALAASQDAHLAVRRFAAAHALGERLLWPMGALYRDEHTALIARLRRELGDDAFDEEWRRGSATSIDEIVRGGLGAALNA